MLNPAAFRKRSNRVLGQLSELAAPALRGVARLAARRPPASPDEWRRGLIVGHSHIGDVLYRTCSLHQLRELLPACRWSYLCAPGAAAVLEGNPALAEVLPFIAGEDSWRLTPGAFTTLREREFDVVLCTNTLRHYPDFALATAIGAPSRVGFDYKGLSGLLTHRTPLTFPSPFAAYFRSMVAHLGGAGGDWPLRPRVYPTDADRAAAAHQWETLGPQDPTPVVACAITTRQGAGNWPRAHLLEALRLARREMPFTVVLCGAASDGPTLRAAAAELGPPVHVLAGALGLRALVAFLERCTALFTLDSGPRHLGNAAGIPVLFARNLSHSMVEAGRYCEGEIDLAPPLEYLSDEEIAAVASRTPPSGTAERLLQTIRQRHPAA